MGMPVPLMIFMKMTVAALALPADDSDNDGVCDPMDVCAGFDDTFIGTPCDDGDACTVFDDL